MKLVTFSQRALGLRPGVLVGPPSAQRVLDWHAAAQTTGDARRPPTSLLDLIEQGEGALDALRRLVEKASTDDRCSHPLDAVTLHAPVPTPPQMRDFSVFPGHIRNAPAGMQRI